MCTTAIISQSFCKLTRQFFTYKTAHYRVGFMLLGCTQYRSNGVAASTCLIICRPNSVENTSRAHNVCQLVDARQLDDHVTYTIRRPIRKEFSFKIPVDVSGGTCIDHTADDRFDMLHRSTQYGRLAWSTYQAGLQDSVIRPEYMAVSRGAHAAIDRTLASHTSLRQTSLQQARTQQTYLNAVRRVAFYFLLSN